MRVILQRVSRARVVVAGESVGEIGNGLVALVGVEVGDRVEQAEKAASKVAKLRVFPDGEKEFSDSVLDAAGAVLVVSNFTLAAKLDKGRRPSFDRAAPAAEAEPLVEAFAKALEEEGVTIETGRFRAHMEVELVNDGPVTLVVETARE